jgi:hypothetical protein
MKEYIKKETRFISSMIERNPKLEERGAIREQRDGHDAPRMATSS